MKKSIVGIILAVALVGSSLAFPTKAYAATNKIKEGENRDYIATNEKGIENNGTVINNDGQVVNNNGTINTNGGEVVNNYKTVTTNDGTVKINKADALISTNNGTVTIDNGKVETNNGVIDVDWGTIVTNAEGGTVNNAFGTVSKNEGNISRLDGKVETNAASGKIISNNQGAIDTNQGAVSTNNRGTIGTNQGTVGTNNGTITENAEGGTIGTNQKTVTTNNGVVSVNAEGGTIVSNNQTVTTNNGTISTNSGTIENNYSDVTTNEGGIVTNNFGGTVNGGEVENYFGGTVNGGTVTNQWYEYILNGGSYVSGSKQTTADNRTWIGKAESTDSELGDYYITVAANSGMTIDYAMINGKTVSYITNADGSISFGDISSAISIFFKQITNNNNNNDDDNSNNTNDSVVSTNDADLVAAIEAVVIAEEKMPVTLFTSDEAVANIPEAAKNSGASYNLSAITTSQGFVAAVNKISENVKAQNAVDNAANNNTARRTSVTVYSDKPMNFTADILNAISDSDIDFVFVFMHNGKMYRVTIPRKTEIDFSGHVYEGPLFIGQILGTTEEIG